MRRADRKNRNRQTVQADDAERLLKPWLPQILECHHNALSFWQSCAASIPKLALDDINNQARARVISNSIARDVKIRFTGRKGITLTEDSGFLVMIIEERIAVRFKKLDNNLRPSNIPTRQQHDFAWQGLLIGFPPEATNLTFGHKLDSTGTGFSGFWLQCPRGNRNLWSIPLDRPVDQPLFSAQESGSDDPAPPVVRPKKTSPKKMAE
jgi:hypothetical protein